jgi:DNA helicase-2/ATP-dependent DNA helicase PcrA
MSRTWSKFQIPVFEFVEHGSGNAIVNAVAGSGKTTTIVEALKLIKGSSLFLAFNKSIADELKGRGVNARTFHSLTYVPVTSFKVAPKVEPDKLKKLVATYFDSEEVKMYGSFCMKMVSLARQTGVCCLVPDNKKTWKQIMEHFNVELENENAREDRGLELSAELLHRSNESDMVDFDDLLYFAVLFNISLPKYDFVLVDEAQDTNAIQRAILKKVMKPTSRMVAVGDPAQAIYGFRGANSNSMDLIGSEFKCGQLPLSISYRCAKSIVKYAQTWVPHIEHADDAPEGEVKHHGTNWKNSIFTCDDLIVCRRTAPLITLAYQLLRDRISVQVLGRDIGEGLKSLIRKMQARGVNQLIEKLTKYQEREVERFKKMEMEAKAEAVADRVSCILTLIDVMPENERSIPALEKTLDDLFSSKKGCVTLSTIHKSKGLEADRVFWLDSDYQPKWPMLPWQAQQEDNLKYVAVTRAKKSLQTIQPIVKVKP